MIYPKNFESKIGFAAVRHEISRRCISVMGSQQCDNMHFHTTLGDVVLLLSQTNEFIHIVQSGREFPLDHFHDLRSVLREIKLPGTFLSPDNLFRLQGTLSTVDGIQRFFSNDDEVLYPALRHISKPLNSCADVTSVINRTLDKFGNVKDSASPLLADLRRQLTSLQGSVSGVLRRVVAEGRTAGYFDNDVQPSMRDGRLVIPVSPMHKRKVKGIVHDESASGKTVFIEPAEVVEANNRIRETEAEIDREIIRILTAVTDDVRLHVDDILCDIDILGLFDFIHAKALFAIDVDGQLPHIEERPHFEWFHAVHPALLLSLREQGKEVVPLNLELNSDQRILLISGPNAGGKSVCLKTVGVVQYMMQCGVLPTLHSNSHMGMVNDIMIDIGDQQSIEDDLSTYSSHLQNMKTFLQQSTNSSLVLIDEFGSGTEPQIGGAIAQAILGQLNNRHVMAVITTHYQNLKQMAENTPGIVNGAMLYDRQHLQPLFQLSVGYPGSSFAIEIARKIGLPNAVIEQASEIVGSDYVNMDKYLLDIVRDRRYWEKKRQEVHSKQKKLDYIIEDYNSRLERLNEQHRDIIRQAKSEAREIVQQSNAQVERTIKEIREMDAEREKTKEVRRRLEEFKQRLENDDSTGSEILQDLQSKTKKTPKKKGKNKHTTAPSTKAPATPLHPGDTVVLDQGTSVGTIINLDEKYALVAFGNIKTRVETDRLQRTMRKPERQAVPSMSRSAQAEIRERQLQFKPDIDVRGMRADDAIQAVTYFIDDAIQFNAGRIRILHGTGTGALREAVRQYLNTVNGVRSYRDEHVQFGGAGITVVDLD